MSDSKVTLAAKATKLRKQLADAEAIVSGLTLKLAQAEAQLTGQTVPLSGLDELWKIALPISRSRSSKHLCRKAWNMLPKAERPAIATMINALKIWNRCPEWKKDGNQYAIALDRWIRERRWEDLPEVAEAGSRYRNPPVIVPRTAPEDAVTDAAEIAELLGVKPRRMNS